MDHKLVRLGKLPARRDPRTLRLAKYFTPELPAPPPSVDWTKGVTEWGMLGNDQVGDCVFAGVEHSIQTAMTNVGAAWDGSVSAGEALKYYGWWAGYVPGDPNTDNGADELTVLTKWRKMGYAGHKLVGFADPDPVDITHVRQSVQLFGGIYIGLQLPLSAQNQSVWDVAGNPYNDPNCQPGSWGGHAVWCVAYDEKTITCITWGELQKMTLRFWSTYCDESHALLLGYWMERGVAPSGFRYAQLLQDVAEVTG